MKKKVSANRKPKWKFPILVYRFCVLVFVGLYIQLAYISLSSKIYGKNMQEFAASRSTVRKNLQAERGTIYDSSNNVLALNVSSYTVIAYLEKSKKSRKDDYVKDVKKTAEALAPILNVDASYLIERMDTDKYQVELGSSGKGITELKKEQIEKLNLPGIDFIEDMKRFYPNGDFASYIIGYALEREVTEIDDDDNKVTSKQITGEMGVEAVYNEELKGTDGYLEYQQDRYGYKINGTSETNVEAIDGNNIYLTIDSGIQRFVESAVKDVEENYHPEWFLIDVMDAKTGDILASSSIPSFNPNVRNIVNYQDPLVSLNFEPGSTMKTYTYMCAMETGNYNGDEKYLSGQIDVTGSVIKDWNEYGWGEVTFDKGYEFSSNVGVVNLINRYLSKKQLRDCFKKYGFGSKTGIELSSESKGNINFNYQLEVATAGFGQGITTTAIQNLQALTIISNNGKMLKPHIIKKIENSSTNDIIYERKKEESEQLVSDETVQKIKQLMYNTVHNRDVGTTGASYDVEGLDVIGKTGTSQIFDPSTGTYKTGDNNYIFSFSGMFPYDSPKYIIYAAMKIPTWGKSTGMSNAVKDVMKSIAKYQVLDSEVKKENSNLTLQSYSSKSLDDVRLQLENFGAKVLILGDGNTIINQYPKAGNSIIKGDLVVLVTNSESYKMPSLIGYSCLYAKKIMNLLSVNYKFEGNGYVISQSKPAGEILVQDDDILISLSEKYIVEEEKNDEEQISE